MKKRPWFQLHLSTCVVMMFVAGALNWANLHDWETDVCKTIRYVGNGWPVYYQTAYFQCNEGAQDDIRISTSKTFAPVLEKGQRISFEVDGQIRELPWLGFDSYTLDPKDWTVHHSSWSKSRLVIDVLLALSALMLIAFSCEWLLRRHERRKQPTSSGNPADNN